MTTDTSSSAEHTAPGQPTAADDPALAPLPPGPRLPMAVQTLLFSARRHRWMPRLRRRYGDVVRLRIYPERSMVEIADVEHIRAIFSGSNTIFHAGEGNVVLKPVMGQHSVLLTDEEQHLRIRKLLMPAFHGAALRGYRDMVAELADAEAERWPVGRPFSTHASMQALTLEVILRVVFGVTAGPRLDELRTLLTRLVDVGPIDLLGWHNPKLQQFGPWRRYAHGQRRVDELLYAEIAERKQARDLERRSDVLSRLLLVTADGERLSDVELRDQLVTLLLAGHETTATALAWALHELARYPALLDEAIRAADGRTSADDKYLEAVAKESMRLHPVISDVARKLTEDVVIGRYRIPAGYTVMPSIALVQADPAHHDDPGEFRPARFLGDGPPTGTWLPFGGGVRRCLGAGFSLMEATVMLRAVLSRYRLTPDRLRPEPAKPRHITLVPGRGARVIARSRK